jgi:hypothetical protein
MPNSFSPGDTLCNQISRWKAFREVADSVLTTLRLPLSLPQLLEHRDSLRDRFRIRRPLRPLQMQEIEQFLS